ncbi:MAG TPA: oligosaccharide flippase family protein [Myxococcota bacterium]
MTETTERRGAGRALFLTLMGFGGGQVIRLVSNLVLTRLLLREDFGLMAIVNSIFTALSLLSDVGIGTSLIQNPRGHEEKFVNTAWSLQINRGMILFVIAAVIGWPASHFYHEPLLLYLVPLAGVSALLQGFSSMRTFLANRELNLGRLTMVELASQAFATVTMLVWAFVQPSIWALAIGGVAQFFCRMALSYLAIPGVRHRYGTDGEVIRMILQFGRWIFVSTLLTFFANQADRLIFGKLVTLDQLGVYSIAVTLSLVPTTALSHLFMNIVFPYFARALREGEDPKLVYRRARDAILGVGAWAHAGLIAGGPTAVHLLYDQRYVDAGWMLQVLAAGSFVGIVLEGPNGQMLLARGESRWMAYTSLGKIVGIVVFVPVGFFLFGFPGAIGAYAAGELLRYGVSAFAANARGFSPFLLDAKLALLVVVAAALGRAAALGVHQLGVPTIVEALTVALVVSAVFAPLLRHLRERLRALR